MTSEKDDDEGPDASFTVAPDVVPSSTVVDDAAFETMLGSIESTLLELEGQDIHTMANESEAYTRFQSSFVEIHDKFDRCLGEFNQSILASVPGPTLGAGVGSTLCVPNHQQTQLTRMYNIVQRYQKIQSNIQAKTSAETRTTQRVATKSGSINDEHKETIPNESEHLDAKVETNLPNISPHSFYQVDSADSNFNRFRDQLGEAMMTSQAAFPFVYDQHPPHKYTLHLKRWLVDPS